MVLSLVITLEKKSKLLLILEKDIVRGIQYHTQLYLICRQATHPPSLSIDFTSFNNFLRYSTLGNNPNIKEIILLI